MSAHAETVATRAAAPRGVLRLMGSNLAAQSAEQVALAAAAIVAVADLGAGPAAAGWLQTAQTLPFLLLAIPAGLIADRASRTRLMVAAEALRAVCLLAVVVLTAHGALTLGALALLGFLGAAGTVAYSVAAPSLVPALVRRERLAGVNARLELARSAAFAAGPAVAGYLVARGAGLAFGAATLLSLIAVALLAGLREPTRAASPIGNPAGRPTPAELGAGIRFIAGHHLMRPVALTAIVFNLSFFVMLAIYVPHAISDLGLSPTGVGASMASYGAGMIAGALLAPMLARRLAFGTQVAIGPLMGFAAALAMLATIAWPSPALAALSFFLIGAGPIVWTITTTTLRQAVTPPALLGRVSAALLTATWGARPLGAGLAAAIATGLGARLGIEACLMAATAGFAIQAAILLASPVARLRSLPDAVSDWT
jgi:predicted MFS family arabinose efflux permease